MISFIHCITTNKKVICFFRTLRAVVNLVELAVFLFFFVIIALINVYVSNNNRYN